MSGGKEFGSGEDFPKKSPSAGKPIFEVNVNGIENFIELQDTFNSYAGRGGLTVVVKADESGLDTLETETVDDKNYVHTQEEANTLWTITHNLGKYPSVRIKDNSGYPMMGDITDISINELTIEFSSEQSGIAILN